MMTDIILASASPRRKELLESLGMSFTVVTSGVEEINDPAEDPARLAGRLALEKAEAVASRSPGRFVLGADTLVVADHDILGKPVDHDDARRMLTQLRDRWHQVITGIALIDRNKGASAVRAIETLVRMGAYSDRVIEDYVASGEPQDKAGGYAIQGRGGALVSGIQGCYTNVVGLPVCEVAHVFRLFGVEPQAPEPVCRDADGKACPRLG